ncbi:TIGR02147 family protein [Hallerella succinigenes]|uniref:Uncharacterized protein (TIGR02147 family) n=2 Tax=Hallerella TaxID=2815788 RepID=A0A2M9A457_9BACT|nr:TIGR02147 family protein [Hallerella succinigenes]MBS7392461.1 TIGR02147 family protein [Fibrobacter sp.]MDD6092051.1 TIGR02147 family protein [Hallerella succinigenes]MDY5028368.1 TIGR02147 family protein [Hallerella succinigenes]PJJ40501.1 uncharacterized protein (TIGR02147 family) [Hallerella succinigenes]
MAEKQEHRKIFEYLDYREFLRDYYQSKKAANPAFSLRAFSDKIGFKAKDFISRVMQGDKNLSTQSIQKIVTGLKFGKREASFFEDLVWFNQAETMDEKNSWFQKMQNELKIVRFTEGQHQLAFYQYQVYSHWRHLVVRSLIGMYGFHGDFTSLAKSVHPTITIEEAKESVELLEKCNLVKKNEDGSYELVNKDITTGDRTSKIALRGFHQHCLALGAESIDRDPPTMRNISGLTLGISQAGYEKIVERMSAFRKEIAQIANEDKDADKVYQMQLLLFPIGGKL